MMQTGKVIPAGSDLEWIESVKKQGARKVSPALLYVKKVNKSDGTDQRSEREKCIIELDKNPVTDITVLKDDFMSRIDEVLYEIFDIEKPFTYTDNVKKCEKCNYKNICRRYRK